MNFAFQGHNVLVFVGNSHTLLGLVTQWQKSRTDSRPPHGECVVIQFSLGGSVPRDLCNN